MSRGKCPYKAGDIIIGNSKNPYGSTGKGVICKVIKVNRYAELAEPNHCDGGHYRDIQVCISDQKGEATINGYNNYDVSSYYFDSLNPQDEDNEI